MQRCCMSLICTPTPKTSVKTSLNLSGTGSGSKVGTMVSVGFTVTAKKQKVPMFAYGEILGKDLQRKHMKLIHKQQVKNGFGSQHNKQFMKYLYFFSPYTRNVQVDLEWFKKESLQKFEMMSKSQDNVRFSPTNVGLFLRGFRKLKDMVSRIKLRVQFPF